MKTISDLQDLPEPPPFYTGKWWGYVRSLRDPRFLLHPFSGEA